MDLSLRATLCLSVVLAAGFVSTEGALRCSSPNSLADGSFKTSDGRYIVGTIVTYTCHNGFQLQGSTQRNCQNDGTWSGEDPTCQPRDECHRHLRRRCHEHAHCKSLDGNWKCICNHGFRGDGFQCGNRDDQCAKILHHRCHDNGECYRISEGKYKCRCRPGYSGDGFDCRAVVCQKPEGIANGRILSNQEKYIPSNIITYQCDHGFRMYGNAQRTCKPSGGWSGQAPKCSKGSGPQHSQSKKQKCNKPQGIPNGSFNPTMEKYSAHTSIYYKCQPGYSLIGNSNRICQDGGKWSGSNPRCEKVSKKPATKKCQRPRNIPNGNIATKDWNFKAGTAVTYQCQNQFKLVGNAQIRCQDSGRWSGAPPMCKVVPKMCDKPQDIPHGSFTPQKAKYPTHSSISYKCNTGYQLKGKSQSNCQPNGMWSGAAPRCEKLNNCEKSGRVCHRHAECRNVGRGYTCVCRGSYSGDGYNCHEKRQDECQKLNHQTCHEHAYCHRISDRKHECRCKEGYSGDGISCTKATRKCNKPQGTAHGSFSPQKGSYDAYNSVTYKCNVGYLLKGSSNRNCQPNGQWSGNAPRCERKRKNNRPR